MDHDTPQERDVRLANFTVFYQKAHLLHYVSPCVPHSVPPYVPHFEWLRDPTIANQKWCIIQPNLHKSMIVHKEKR